jgi:hypothetical protein
MLYSLIILCNLEIVDDQIYDDEVGGACSMHGRDEKCIKNFGSKT